MFPHLIKYYSTQMSLSQFQESVEDRERWCAAIKIYRNVSNRRSFEERTASLCLLCGKTRRDPAFFVHAKKERTRLPSFIE